jgi:hypothetical protein
MELAARDAQAGFTKLYNRKDAATLREAIAALSRPLPGVMEGMEPSDCAVVEALDGYANSFETEIGFDSRETCMKEAIRRAMLIDLAPRVADGYARGVEDAANKAKQHAHGYGQYRDHAQAKSACETLATEILALLPKESATEDTQEKETNCRKIP